MRTPIIISETKKCPICGRQPRAMIFSNITVIRCKPLFQNTHLRISVCGEGNDINTDKAIKKWNEKVHSLTTQRKRKNTNDKKDRKV